MHVYTRVCWEDYIKRVSILQPFQNYSSSSEENDTNPEEGKLCSKLNRKVAEIVNKM